MQRIPGKQYEKFRLVSIPVNCSFTFIRPVSSQGIDIAQYVPASKEFDVWELWTKYDVDEDGEEDDIVLTF